MIAKVLRGWRPGGLLAYLFGPGRFEQHRDPRVVASWDGAPWLYQPDKLAAVVLGGERLEPGEFDFDLRPLTVTMQEPARLAGLPVTTPPPLAAQWAEVLRAGGELPADAPPWLRHYRYDAKRGTVVVRPGYVWHCPVRLHPDDPTLTDAQWRHVAERLMRAVGIAQAGCRWIAVRHADDHIHLMAVLVNEETGARFHPYRDFPKLRAECQRLERELGLRATAGADRTAASAPTRAELGKAQRLGRPRSAREELRQVVAQCAAASSDGPQFLAELAKEGLDPRTVRDAGGRVCGYTVALFGDRTATGTKVRFSGRTLAPDLSWPALATRWATTAPVVPLPCNAAGRVVPAARHHAIGEATRVVEQATALIRSDVNADVEAIAHGAGELLMVFSRGREGRVPGPLTKVARRYDRAARTPYQVLPSSCGQLAAGLRHAVRQLGAVGVLTGRGQERLAAIALLLALAGLVAEIAAWQHDRGRVHQAAAARDTARQLPTLAQTPSAARAQLAPAYLRPDLAARPPAARPEPRPRGHRR